MHSITGEVTTLTQVEAGWTPNAIGVGVNVTVRVSIPYVRLVDDKPTNAVHQLNMTMFYPPTEMPPSIGDIVTLSLAPADENVSIN